MNNVFKLLVVAVLAWFAVAMPVAAASPEACRNTLESLIETADHPDLRWSDFSRLRVPVRQLYELNAYQPVWLAGDRPTRQALAVMEALEQVANKGLNPRDYESGTWAGRAASLRDFQGHELGCEQALFDLALTVSFMRYLGDLRVGRVDPKEVRIHLDVRDKKLDLALFVREVSLSEDVAASLARVEPPYRHYWALLEALRTYRELEKDPRLSEPLTPVRKLEPGDRYADLERLVYRLRRFGDLTSDVTAQLQAGVYDGPLVEAVERFQRRHGLTVDGIIGKKTLRRLNTPVSERVKQIELSLERYRWLPDDLGYRPIVVNVPGFELRAYDTEADQNLRNALSMNVIVGESYPRHQTPLFRGQLKHVVFGPYWNVPYSILRRELYPKIAWDPEFIPMNGYEIVSHFSPHATPLPINEENIQRLLSGEVKLRQRPGKRNALGEVKFLFPNRHSVYLHGTPAKRLFSRDQRDFSHGCIRVQDPAALAEYVLKQEGWGRERVDRTIARGTWKQVNLSQPIDVYVLYGTAAADPNAGTVYFYNDIYGHDAKLERALAAVYR